MGPLDVAVVGTGTAGSATALFLARQGHRVTVYEKVPEPQSLGAGIMLSQQFCFVRPPRPAADGSPRCKRRGDWSGIGERSHG